jgi:hypothetical protein
MDTLELWVTIGGILFLFGGTIRAVVQFAAEDKWKIKTAELKGPVIIYHFTCGRKRATVIKQLKYWCVDSGNMTSTFHEHFDSPEAALKAHFDNPNKSKIPCQIDGEW